MNNPKHNAIFLEHEKPPSSVSCVRQFIYAWCQFCFNDLRNFLIDTWWNTNIPLMYGLCCTTANSIGGQKSVRNLPLSESTHANPSFCSHIKWSINLISSTHRKSSWALVRVSLCSAVYCPLWVNGGGTFSKAGIFSKGLPLISLIILVRATPKSNSVDNVRALQGDTTVLEKTIKLWWERDNNRTLVDEGGSSHNRWWES